MTNKDLIEIGIEDVATRKAILALHGEKIEDAKERATTTTEKAVEQAEKKAEREKAALQKQRDELQKVVDALPDDGGEDWKAKYDELKTSTEKKLADQAAEIKGLKDGYESEKATAKKAEMLGDALIKAGANTKYVKKMIKDIDLATVELDGDIIKDVDKTVAAVKGAGWDGMFGDVETVGVDVANPPKNGAAGKKEPETLEEAIDQAYKSNNN